MSLQFIHQQVMFLSDYELSYKFFVTLHGNWRSAITKTRVITSSYSMPEILASLKNSLGSFRASVAIFP